MLNAIFFVLQKTESRRPSFGLPEPADAVAEAVDDRVAAVAAESLAANLDARGRLPALVFGDVEQTLDAFDHLRRVAAGDDLVQGRLLLDQAMQYAVEVGIGRQAVLVGLVVAQLGAGRLG